MVKYGIKYRDNAMTAISDEELELLIRFTENILGWGGAFADGFVLRDGVIFRSAPHCMSCAFSDGSDYEKIVIGSMDALMPRLEKWCEENRIVLEIYYDFAPVMPWTVYAKWFPINAPSREGIGQAETLFFSIVEAMVRIDAAMRASD